MKTHFYFFTEWKNNFLAAFSMHPTTSTTRTCKGDVVRGEEEEVEEEEEGGGRKVEGKKDKGKL